MPLQPLSAFGFGGQQQDQQDTDPMALITRLQTMRSQGQKLKENELALQEKQNKIDDDEAIDSALKASVSPGQQEPDWNKALYMLHAQGRGSAALGLQNRVFEWRKSQAETLKTEIANNGARVKMASEMAQGITDDVSFKRILPQIAKVAGKDAAAVLGDSYDPEVVKSAIAQGRSAQDFIKQTKDTFDMGLEAMKFARDQRNDVKDWEKSKPEVIQKFTNVASAKLSLAKSQQDWDVSMQLLNGMMDPLSDADKKAVLGQFGDKFNPQAAEMARKLGMTQHERSQETTERGHLALEQQKMADEENQASQLTPEAIDMLSLKIAKTGSFEGLPMGLGKTATLARNKIYNRAAEMFANLDLATQQVAYKSNAGAIVKLQGTLSNLNAYEKTALANLNVFIEQAKKVVDSGSPLLNKPLRSFDEKVLGSPTMAAYNAARTVVIPEFAKIIAGGPNLTGVLTNEARDEIDGILKGDATLKQIYEVAKILPRDAANRRTAYETEIAGLKKVIATPPKSTPATASTVSDFGQSAKTPVPPGMVRMKAPDGTVADIPAAQKAAALAKGAIEVVR